MRDNIMVPSSSGQLPRETSMRRILSLVLVLSVAAVSLPSYVSAQAQTPALKGTAYSTSLKPLPNVRVQIRSIYTGEVLHSTVSNDRGEFAFGGLSLRDGYIVELIDSSGRIVGMTAPFGLQAGTTLNVSVVDVASSSGTVAAAESAGFSVFGLGPTASLAVLGAAGAAAVTAVVATRQDASPSR